VAKSAHAKSLDLPKLIEIDREPASVVPGYRWYRIRDRRHVFSGTAAGVRAGEPPLFLHDDLIFDCEDGEGIDQRLPTYPGEESHVLLRSSFALPTDLAAINAREVPSAVTPFPAVVFEEETLPVGVPGGYRAFTVTLNAVYTGVLETIVESNGTLLLAGPDLNLRPSRDAEVSRVLVPPGVEIPAAFRRPP
jgi:hypothetical protein